MRHANYLTIFMAACISAIPVSAADAAVPKSEISASRLAAAEENEWKSLGTAHMQDGWFLPYFGYEFTRRNIIACEMQESVAEPGFYRLVNPFSPENLKKMGLEEYNLDNAPADIYIDAIDPEYICVLGQYSGLTIPAGKIDDFSEDTKLYVGSANSFLESNGIPLENIKTMAYGGKFVDGVITVRGSMWGTDPDIVPGSVWASKQTMFDTRIALPGHDIAPVHEQGRWEKAGTARFTDGWFGPRCGELGGKPYEVEVERNLDKKGLYRLVNPFVSSSAPAMLAKINEGPDPEGDYYLAMDLSDPDHVSIPVQPSGIVVENLDILIGNYVGYVSETFNWDYAKSAEFIINGYDENYVDSFKDGVITVKCPSFGAPGTFRYEFYWQDEDYMTSVIDMKDVFSGIGGVKVEDDDEVEYYSLQGIRILNPESGSVVIKRGGGKTEKIIMP